MAKRVKADDVPYRPVEAALVQSVISGPRKKSESNVLRFPLTEEKTPEEEGVETWNGEEEERKPEPPLPTRTKIEPFDQLIRVLMSKSEKAALENIVNRLAKRTDTTLKISHLMRAFALLLRQSEKELLEEARRGTRLVRPSNGNPMAIVDFEQRVAETLLGAFKKTSSL